VPPAPEPPVEINAPPLTRLQTWATLTVPTPPNANPQPAPDSRPKGRRKEQRPPSSKKAASNIGKSKACGQMNLGRLDGRGRPSPHDFAAT
jgi:hypothetical protein